MVKRGPWLRPQASEGEAQHGSSGEAISDAVRTSGVNDVNIGRGSVHSCRLVDVTPICNGDTLTQLRAHRVFV